MLKEDRTYQICTRCIMDTSDPLIQFDKNGVCNHCYSYDEKVKKGGYRAGVSEDKLETLIHKIKEDGKGKKYDCILGISGGVDSAYMAYLASELKLRILAVHVDAGWNSRIAVENIKKLCLSLNIDLHTVVIDWETMKELQRAYMFSGLVNIDVPQDHAFLAATYGYARKHHIGYMLNGSNLSTESIMPSSWIYSAMDYVNLKSVYHKLGRNRGSLYNYPHINLFQYFRYEYLKWPERINILNFVPYTKTGAMELLNKKFGWEYYGGKHFESIFTRFMQEVYLPQKYGIQKKRAHMASLVVSGEMSRNDALIEMENTQNYTEEQKHEDIEYILKKLDISLDEWDSILRSDCKNEDDYKNNKNMLKALRIIKNKLKR